MLADFVSLFFPETCLNCNETLISAENFICTTCKLDLPKTNDHVNEENQLYQKFVFEPLVKSASAFLYYTKNGIAQKLIHELKYGNKPRISNSMGLLYGVDLCQAINPDIIIPVPLHKVRLKKRGYNQSSGFARGLCESFENSVVREDLIHRIKNTQSQTRNNKISRWTNVENIYSDSSESLEEVSVLVVDDVITTGATVGMLCSKLKKAGASSIHVACIARG